MKKPTVPFTFVLVIIALTGMLLTGCGQTSTPAVPTSGGATAASPEAPTSQSEIPTSQPDIPVVPTSGGSDTSTTLEGRVLMESRCTKCHTTNRIESAHKTAEQWKTTVDRMISKGAELNPQEAQVLVDFLAQNFK